MLTFSDDGQKKLYLKEGGLTGNVNPQPAGKPMLIYTRLAMLEVLGTQFEIEAESTSTMLNVSEGKVRVKRITDDSIVDVPAQHRVMATIDRDMLPERVPNSVNHWISQLHQGPDGTHGKWSPQTEKQPALLKAIPFTAHWGFMIYLAACEVTRGESAPVTLQSGSQIRVRGHLNSPHNVYFGTTVRHSNGEFAGIFETIVEADKFEERQDFEVLLKVRDFYLSPVLKDIKDKLPSTPFDLVVDSIWCHSTDKPIGLEITEIEIIPATL